MIARCFAVALTLVAVFGVSSSEAREIVDMAGRRIDVPDKITRVYSASYPLTVLLYVLAPDLLVAVNVPPNGRQLKFLPPVIGKLPASGGRPMRGPAANPEEVMALKPDLIVAWLEPMHDRGVTDRNFGRTGLRIAYIQLDSITDYPPALKFLGELLDRRERATELADYISKAIARVEKAVASAPDDKKVRYYYAEGPDGLATECSNSFHVEAMRLAGGYNIDQCRQSNHIGMERISLEQVMVGQPNLIIALTPGFRQKAKDSARWRNVEAVARDRIATVPRMPFNWLDRPPGFMRALGAQWLAHLFYPELYPVDMTAETKKFYKLFFHVDLSDADVERIMR
ncbi:ABC transporter substrate-binding protein [Rhodoblastus acidophilus]|uniref:ABC transporter substrate-binding protein n=1 Tax=Candidatus Rhodoblastus alkanivorans TaxID=2954117 RepID=A0ABS9Z5Y7_9HYPH|nr:ABC transporter substrate-binding protein [Candidatus Rhodoblastus alkanivorans]MCI4678634.1 ABC transporter substrate-binding protein [Candidatus Rhodoblastus alkanivorans]MCI4683044.1 ABC transporter substrate-binding protein [Candidatus Rhodoblastus alkanivorans]MDI4640354.1 ABC transporter substrate-binding protein [Rhodoblastus acidophilus]